MEDSNELVNLYPTPVCVHKFDAGVFKEYRGNILKTAKMQARNKGKKLH